MSYPYQKPFERELRRKGLAQTTVTDYSNTLARFYDYEAGAANQFAETHDPNDLLESDVRYFLSMLIEERHVQNATYNKILSHLNVYFKYLFARRLIDQYPTLTLKGHPKEELDPTIHTEWLDQLPELLADERLQMYTRMMLLLISKGYQVGEMLQPGFYQQMNQISFQPNEKQFLQAYKAYIAPLQERQHNPNLFLKTRIKPGEPLLSLPALHKYLKKDRQVLNQPLVPSKLYQGYVLDQVRNSTESSEKLMERLRLDPAGLAYYRKMLGKS
ncbi:hypothetical protein IV38_GL001270 [Lactobacillus selangorensis]|uniref:Core-binding (CB) domain-containing protein n=1 Tax=Lactobacillus selangorensis TaxID=81857 RepID=A0A0R2FND6_9LACO|nr:phage integrase N-terminal SAM-like domain-containing protein [Lactobacillus selangorensis]KRN29054.1 hypothetical protein IV38_GL001270 [Lactobacillus selangorensis]KRN30033.1 hypothetical protein IV40_GL002062 [Lactobacillus selangorensis]